jgi:nucleoside phosphorylase
MQNPLSTPKCHEDYTVAVICALSFELSAVRYMLDCEHPRLSPRPGDPNIYIFGELSGHNVVLAFLPGTQGKGTAAIVVTNMARTFPYIEWRFLVGIGEGVPNNKHDIRLGDVVVSTPEGPYGGVVQYDLGKSTDDDFQLKGFLLPPPTMLRGAVELMRSDHLVADNKVVVFLSQLLQRAPGLSIYRHPPEDDVLFDADYPHVPSGSRTCENCDTTRLIRRPPRHLDGPKVHYGLIASGDQAMKRAARRNAAAGNVGDILCFEMEAAGIATEFPCIVIRGVSDYADSHKNDNWQSYAASAAAASAKELLSYVAPKQRVDHGEPVTIVLGYAGFIHLSFLDRLTDTELRRLKGRVPQVLAELARNVNWDNWHRIINELNAEFRFGLTSSDGDEYEGENWSVWKRIHFSEDKSDYIRTVAFRNRLGKWCNNAKHRGGCGIIWVTFILQLHDVLQVYKPEVS